MVHKLCRSSRLRNYSTTRKNDLGGDNCYLVRGKVGMRRLVYGPPLYSAVGVAVVGLTNNIPVRLSSSSEELTASH